MLCSRSVAFGATLILAAFVSCSLGDSGPECDASATRTNCGYVGITQGECANQGCCWSPVNPNPNNLPWCFNPSAGKRTCHADGIKRNCGYVGIDEQVCHQRGCCWDPVGKDSNTPWCFHQNEAPFAGYKVVSSSATATGMELMLSPINANATTAYGPPIESVKVSVIMETGDRLHVKITDASSERYEVPSKFLPRPTPPSSRPSSPNYVFSFTESPFGFAVSRTDGTVLFNSSGETNAGVSPFIFTDQFWELGTTLQSGSSIFGLGEQSQSAGFRLVPGSTLTMWNRDQPAMTSNQNLYGSHPFYLDLGPDGRAHGVFLLNSNGMDIDYAENSMTYRVIGGIPDFYFFVGPTPAATTQQYQEVIGFPHMPPYWSLGFHQCRYGYPDIDTVENVVANYRKANIPLETMWNDIDYMDQYRDWTFDPKNYPTTKMQAFVNALHENGQKYVVIVDPAIFSQDNNYLPLEKGLEDNIFILDSNGKPCQGTVWPGKTYFPDWTNPNISDYWGGSIKAFLDTVPVDGLWIDMNEPSSFQQGCGGSNSNGDVASMFASATTAVKDVKDIRGGSQQGARHGGRRRVTVRSGRSKSPLGGDARGLRSAPSNSAALRGQFDPNNPPYTINNCGDGCPLNTKTISMDALQYPYQLGDKINNHYNLHNLYGFTESIATAQALQKTQGKRAFIISRSTYAGSGKHVGHWSGDNASSWPDLQFSISDQLNMGIFGVSLMGSDICGFLGSTTPELCSRWIALGSFYTFSRNHNTKGAPSQELYLWPSVANVSRKVINNRYRMLPYMYTLLNDAHTKGDTVWRPLFFEFPKDPNTHGIGSQFMVGSAIMVTPVITQGATSVTGYFPNSTWYDWWTGEKFSGSVPGSNVLSAPIDHIPVHIRGGSILPTQQYSGLGSVVRSDPYEIVVALDANGAASGTLYVDDGETLDENPDNVSVSYSINSSSGAYKLSASNSVATYKPAAGISVASVTVYGAPSKPSGITINGSTDVPATSISYDTTNKVLTFSLPSSCTLGESWFATWSM